MGDDTYDVEVILVGGSSAIVSNVYTSVYLANELHFFYRLGAGMDDVGSVSFPKDQVIGYMLVNQSQEV